MNPIVKNLALKLCESAPACVIEIVIETLINIWNDYIRDHNLPFENIDVEELRRIPVQQEEAMPIETSRNISSTSGTKDNLIDVSTEQTVQKMFFDYFKNRFEGPTRSLNSKSVESQTPSTSHQPQDSAAAIPKTEEVYLQVEVYDNREILTEDDNMKSNINETIDCEEILESPRTDSFVEVVMKDQNKIGGNKQDLTENDSMNLTTYNMTGIKKESEGTEADTFFNAILLKDCNKTDEKVTQEKRNLPETENANSPRVSAVEISKSKERCEHFKTAVHISGDGINMTNEAVEKSRENEVRKDCTAIPLDEPESVNRQTMSSVKSKHTGTEHEKKLEIVCMSLKDEQPPRNSYNNLNFDSNNINSPGQLEEINEKFHFKMCMKDTRITTKYDGRLPFQQCVQKCKNKKKYSCRSKVVKKYSLPDKKRNKNIPRDFYQKYPVTFDGVLNKNKLKSTIDQTKIVDNVSGDVSNAVLPNQRCEQITRTGVDPDETKSARKNIPQGEGKARREETFAVGIPNFKGSRQMIDLKQVTPRKFNGARSICICKGNSLTVEENSTNKTGPRKLIKHDILPQDTDSLTVFDEILHGKSSNRKAKLNIPGNFGKGKHGSQKVNLKCTKNIPKYSLNKEDYVSKNIRKEFLTMEDPSNKTENFSNGETLFGNCPDCVETQPKVKRRAFHNFKRALEKCTNSYTDKHDESKSKDGSRKEDCSLPESAKPAKKCVSFTEDSSVFYYDPGDSIVETFHNGHMIEEQKKIVLDANEESMKAPVVSVEVSEAAKGNCTRDGNTIDTRSYVNQAFEDDEAFDYFPDFERPQCTASASGIFEAEEEALLAGKKSTKSKKIAGKFKDLKKQAKRWIREDLLPPLRKISPKKMKSVMEK